MQTTITELEALARLTHTPEWRVVEPVIGRLLDQHTRALVGANEHHLLLRAQGAVQALQGFLDLARSSAETVLKKRGG